MIIYALMLTMGLDMSLPEFQPEKDLSGNYIVGTYDVSSGDVYVETLDDVPVDENSSVDDSLSTSPVRIETVTNESYLPTYVLNGFGFVTSDSNPRINRDSSKNIRYVELSVGYVYTFLSDAPRVWLAYSLDNDAPITEVTSPIQVESNAYLCVLDTRYLNVTAQPVSIPDDPSGNNPSGGNFDDSNIVQGLVDIKNLVDLKFRVIIFLNLMAFSYPIVCAIAKNIIGGDK